MIATYPNQEAKTIFENCRDVAVIRLQNRFGGPSCSLGNGGVLARNGQNPLAVVFHLPPDEVQLVMTLDVGQEIEWVPALVHHNRVGLVVIDQLTHLEVYVAQQGVHPEASLAHSEPRKLRMRGKGLDPKILIGTSVRSFE